MDHHDHGGSLRIDQYETPENRNVAGVVDNEMMHAIYNTMQNLYSTTEELKASLEVRFGGVSTRMTSISSKLNHISAQPFYRKGVLSSACSTVLDQSTMDGETQDRDSTYDQPSYMYTLKMGHI